MKMIQPKDPKKDPQFGMAMGASRGMRGGTSGEAVQRGYREGIPGKPNRKPEPVGGEKKKPYPEKTGGNKIKPEAYKAYILARGKI